MEFVPLEAWHFSWVEIVSGMVGGLVSSLLKDEYFVLPQRSGHKIILGTLTACLVGGFVAFIVNTHPALCALMGYSAQDVLLALRRRVRQSIGAKNGSQAE